MIVYNTTDNRSSLSITDLTSDSEYSVTVAGRDGAGRLGQESEKLNSKHVVNFVKINVYIIIIFSFNYSWKCSSIGKNEFYNRP